MNRVRFAVNNFFKQALAVVDLAHTTWNGVGTLFFQTARVILSQLQALAIGLIDIADGLITGTYRAAIPKKNDPPE
ncbi:hypothetical protein LCGC14_1124210 [marine sediment metagenome]|uniref:Uncharacterized protein n=1 Tax=marine sediment metagenome TaxID=412755 RepID=A0A0F9MQZ9_9ZZZZ